MRVVGVLLFTIFLFGSDCHAQTWWDQPPNSVLLFGGQFTTEGLYNSFKPTAPRESNYIVGGAYERDFFQKWGFVVGAEVGVASRFGMGDSVEGWVGLHVRYSGLCSSIAYVLRRGLRSG